MVNVTKNIHQMPEAIETLIAAEALHDFTRNHTLKSITPLSGRYIKNEIMGLDFILNKKVFRVLSKGKLIYFVFESSNEEYTYMLITLGMTGSLQIMTESNKDLTPAVQFVFTDESSHEKIFYLYDPRRFGTIVGGNQEYFDKRVDRIGVSVFSDLLTTEYVMKKIGKVRANKSLVKFLMDQSIIAGIGNYIKCESLYRAKIMPDRELKSLNQQEVNDLVESIKFIVNKSYELGGVSVKDYYHLDGTKGNFSKHFSVYNQKFDPNGVPVLKMETDDDRTTWYVPI